MGMKVKTKIPVKQADGSSVDTEVEIEVPQEQIDDVVKQRVNREKEKDNKEIADLKKQIEDLASKNTTSSDEKTKELEKKLNALTDQLLVGAARTRILDYVQANGVNIPKKYLDTVKIEATDSEETLAEKVKAAQADFDADMKKYTAPGTTAVPVQVGNTAQGAPKNLSGDAELLALIPKEPALAFLKGDHLSDAEKVAIVKRMQETGQLAKLQAAKAK